MTFSPIVFYPGSGRHPNKEIMTVQGQNVYPALVSASDASGIPAVLLLGCIMAESGLDSRAERWGPDALTAQAKAALRDGDMAKLRDIIPKAGNDISFGLGQRIVKFHYHGDGHLSLGNILAVRQFVFDHTDLDVHEAATKLRSCHVTAQKADLTRVGGDALLGACVVYNAGHYPAADEAYWSARASTVKRYKEKLAEARTKLGI